LKGKVKELQSINVLVPIIAGKYAPPQTKDTVYSQFLILLECANTLQCVWSSSDIQVLHIRRKDTYCDDLSNDA